MSTNGHGPIIRRETPHPETARGEKMSAAEVVNPSHWHNTLEGYVESAHFNRTPLSTLLIDIDALKATNDELGHDEGNRLIDMVNHVTSVIPMSIRADNAERAPDVITSHSSAPAPIALPDLKLPEPKAARIGGDEFGIILPNADEDGAEIVAERIRENVAHQLKRPENRPLAEIGVGVSVGIAELKPDMTASDLLRSADKSMFADKLKQLRPLSHQEEASLLNALIYLKDAGVRPRDIPKYIQTIGTTAMAQAIKTQRDS